MPVMDGFKATQEIRKLCEAHGLNIHIVALTAYTTEGFKDKSFASGMNLYITKPINAD